MISSSERSRPPSLAKTSGWFGTIRSSATTDRVVIAMSRSPASVLSGALRFESPPPTRRRAVGWATVSGLMIVSQWRHSGLSTSAVDSQRCDTSSRR